MKSLSNIDIKKKKEEEDLMKREEYITARWTVNKIYVFSLV